MKILRAYGPSFFLKKKKKKLQKIERFMPRLGQKKATFSDFSGFIRKIYSDFDRNFFETRFFLREKKKDV